LQVTGYCQGGEYDGQVGLDGLALVVEDGLCRRSDYADAGVLMPARPGYAGRGSRHNRREGHRLLSQVRMSGGGW
jgi:hypothetical protein